MATLGKGDEGAASLGKATLGKHLERNEKEGEEEGKGGEGVFFFWRYSTVY